MLIYLDGEQVITLKLQFPLYSYNFKPTWYRDP